MFVLALAMRQLIGRDLWRPRADTVARLYTAALVLPPVGSVWLVTSAFLPRLWLTPEAFEAVHSAPYHQLECCGATRRASCAGEGHRRATRACRGFGDD